jgi:hypothetical protein
MRAYPAERERAMLMPDTIGYSTVMALLFTSAIDKFGAHRIADLEIQLLVGIGSKLTQVQCRRPNIAGF